mmetsp:Transcript_69205/g.162670  ORF Transcript_69205/g.162670 Transcript_69205/m.162670 type:complete len:128 (-) Transcript_69205:18-401(-)
MFCGRSFMLERHFAWSQVDGGAYLQPGGSTTMAYIIAICGRVVPGFWIFSSTDHRTALQACHQGKRGEACFPAGAPDCSVARPGKAESKNVCHREIIPCGTSATAKKVTTLCTRGGMKPVVPDLTIV